LKTRQLNTRHLLSALALVVSAASAQASPLLLQDAVISASYNGLEAGMLGLDHQFAQESGSHISRLDPSDSGVEFLTADYLFGIDFSASGAMTVFANAAIAPGAYSMRFDFGSSLAAPITSLRFVGADGASGLPGLVVLDSHTIALDLASLDWREFGTLTAQIDAAAAVPEPASSALAFAGLGVLAGALRRRRRQG
jgi:hypothetical protein